MTNAINIEPYCFAVHFTREFTRGALVGLTHDDKLKFVELASAEHWVKRMTERGEFVGHRLINVRIVAL